MQAARSGVQNIAEGSVASGTSKKMELTNVAKASLEELRLDYEDFLRHRGLARWVPDDPRRKALVARRCATADEVAAWVKENGLDGSADPSIKSIKSIYAGASANAALVLIGVAVVLLDRQVQALAAGFGREGGFTERLYRMRQQRRRGVLSGGPEGAPRSPAIGAGGGRLFSLASRRSPIHGGAPMPDLPDHLPVRCRFAPSPTGYLHVGGARTALFNWLFARRHGGTFALRIEDTDAARNTEEAQEAILGGLRWLGIDWDEGPEVGGGYGPYAQGERGEIYDRYFGRLVEAGHIYDDEGAARFRSPKKTYRVADKVCGEVVVDRSAEPDMTVRRPDGTYIFHFVNVVDDIEMAITHVIRGEDHLMNTGKHLELYEAFGADPPEFAHIPLILNPDGTKMSKRDHGAAVSSYRAGGFLPEAVRNYLCLLGWSPKDDREILPIEDVIALFDWDHLNHSNSRFDMEKCTWLNGQYLAALPPERYHAAARDYLGVADTPALALDLVRTKIRTFAEIPQHLAPIVDSNTPIDHEAALKVQKNPELHGQLNILAERLAGTHWEEDDIRQAIAETADELGTKPGKLMFPLRLAATGVGHGTDLVPTLLLMGREETVERILRRLPLLFPADDVGTEVDEHHV